MAGATFTVSAQVAAWLVEQFLLVAGLPQPAWLPPRGQRADRGDLRRCGHVARQLPQSATIRTIGRAWALSAVALVALSLPRAIAPVHHELYLAVWAVLAAIAALLIRRRRRNTERAPRSAALLGLAAGIGPARAVVVAGALGGALETALAVVGAVALGFLSAAILDRSFWAAFTPGPGRSTVRLVLVGGSAAGVALAVLAAAVGHRGAQLPALVVLPAAGYAAAALVALSDGRSSAPIGWLAGAAAVGPLAFVDPEEISLALVSGRDVPFWTAVAAVAAWAAALLVGAALSVAPRPLALRRGIAVSAAAATLGAGVVVHLGLGSPGLHGDRLFVILKEQADLSTVARGTGQAGRDARAREVYRRLVAHAQESQAALRRDLRRLGLKHQPYYLVNAIEVEGGPLLRAWLSRHPDVDRVLISQRARPIPAPPPVERGSQPPRTVHRGISPCSAPTRSGPSWV